MDSNLAENIHILGDEKILTVSELSNAIKGIVEQNFVSIKLQGEVSGLKHHSSGHTYLSLKDKDSVIAAVYWRGTKLSVTLEEGMEIVAEGKVTTYTPKSQYTFIIKEANIAGEGSLLKLLNERKKIFAAKGYFDKEKKKPIPKFPKIIGIITSKTGAVLQDMRHRLEDRYPFCQVLVLPTNVQGAGAAEQIVKAVHYFNNMTENRPETLIVARGGGSIEDLWCFNEEIVIKAVFDSEIPIISAVGHETDWTLIDYVSDLRAPTPTAAIELSTPVLRDIKSDLSSNTIRLVNAMERILSEQKLRINSYSRYLSTSVNYIVDITQRFDDKIERMNKAISNYVNNSALFLKSIRIITPTNYLTLRQQTFLNLVKSYEKIQSSYITQAQEKISVLANRLEQSSFRKILSKGFCFITDPNGVIVETKTKFEDNRHRGLNIHFQDGITKI